MEFMFNMGVIETVVQKIKDAKKYVRIAIDCAFLYDY